ncbi:hypothetical protein BE04_09310, partial [Sorangium cellulosum]
GARLRRKCGCLDAGRHPLGRGDQRRGLVGLRAPLSAYMEIVLATIMVGVRDRLGTLVLRLRRSCGAFRVHSIIHLTPFDDSCET